MAKIAIVSFGMSDMIIPMAKHLASSLRGEAEVSLFLAYARNKKKEGIVSFDKVPVSDGFLPHGQLEAVIGQGVLKYVDGQFGISVFVYHNLRFRSLINAWLSIRLMRRLRKFDLIHINGMDGTLLHLLPFLEWKKWMITVHDFRPHEGEGSLRSFRLQEVVLKRAKRIVIQNRADFRYIGKYYPELAEKTVFLPFGYLDVYKSFLAEGAAPAPAFDILFFGRISPYKGLEYLLDALDMLKVKGLRPKVAIAGGGAYDFGRARLEEMDNVTFLNRYIANEELAALISNAAMVVCPYTEATQSGVLMTAFAFGKPVAATSVGSFADVVIPDVNGYLAPPGNAAALAAAIEKLLAAPGAQARIARNIEAYEGLEQYRWEHIAGQLQALYKSL